MPEHRHHAFRILASGIVGRPISIVYLVAVDARSYTDGERIYLAAIRDIRQQRLELLVQAALIAGGALEQRRLRALVGRSELARRYLIFEVHRCCRQLEDLLPSGLLKALLNYPLKVMPSTTEQSLKMARGRVRLPTPPEWFGVIKPWLLLRSNGHLAAESVDQEQLSEIEAQLQTMLADEEEDEDKFGRSSIFDALSSPLGGDSAFSRFMKDLLDMRSTPGDSEAGSEGGGTELVSGRMGQRVQQTINTIRSLLPLQLPASYLEAESGSHNYQEWDCVQGRYRPHWTLVEEVEPHSDQAQFDAGQLSDDYVRPLQRVLSRLCLNYQRHKYQSQGDDIETDRLVRLAVDLRAGYSGDDRIYSASLRTRRDLGVQILLDVSSSTLERNAQGNRVFDLQVQAAWQICKALCLLGDRVALDGFHSWGRSLVRFQKIKSFDEPMGAHLEERLQHLSVAGYTRCGAAIRHAAHTIKKYSGTPHQLLLVISDGYPFDDQYEGEYAAEDTRKALLEAHDQDVACICLSVGSDADGKQLSQVYGQANYLSVETVAQLAGRLQPVMEAAIGSVVRRNLH